ncbi:MAG: aldehyde ferredoxin oxidoreductase family protein [Promethearchaeota archaeon]|jgi:aldehyde:ferredoxin oxidoreductase
MPDIYGIQGKILRINLTTRSSKVEDLSSSLVEKYIGGRGLGAYYLAKEVNPDVEPFSEANKLIFMNGPLSGTLIPGNNKICVTFKSPLTNSYSYSLCGGHFGPELKFAGFDGLIIEGSAAVPVYLWINNEQVEFRDATKIWGSLVPEAESLIRNDLGGDKSVQISVIGKSGENLNRYACITSSLFREFGRGGAGAVMGSKKLKGIAIKGSKDVMVFDNKKVKALSELLSDNIRNSGGGIVRRKYGTNELVERINSRGFWVTRNFTSGYFEEGAKLEGSKMREAIVFGDSSCFMCPIACGKRTAITLPNGEEIIMEGPEFETVGSLGSNCGISDWEILLKATRICDRYGMDTMNAGFCVSLAMECFEKGYISLEDTNGINLKFGNGDALIEVLELIGKREGIGNILAEGVKFAAEKFGAPELAMESKGQSLAVYDPRGAKAMALTYATSPKGAHHMIATTFGPEIATGTRLEEVNKALLQRNHQFSMCIVDSIGICSTMRGGVPLMHQAEAYSAVTGIKADEVSLNKAAERIINLERLYNVKIGFSRKDDRLPKRFTDEVISEGESKGHTVNLEFLLDEFYETMNWDKNGIPTEEKLNELNIMDIF